MKSWNKIKQKYRYCHCRIEWFLKTTLLKVDKEYVVMHFGTIDASWKANEKDFRKAGLKDFTWWQQWTCREVDATRISFVFCSQTWLKKSNLVSDHHSQAERGSKMLLWCCLPSVRRGRRKRRGRGRRGCWHCYYCCMLWKLISAKTRKRKMQRKMKCEKLQKK